MIVAQAALVWKLTGDVADGELNHFIQTGQLSEVEEAVMPYNPVIMQAIANQKWSM